MRNIKILIIKRKPLPPGVGMTVAEYRGLIFFIDGNIKSKIRIRSVLRAVRALRVGTRDN